MRKIVLKKYLLFLIASFIFDANASFFEKYSENGLCIHVIKNNTEDFSLVPKSSAVAIGDREVTEDGIKTISAKKISGTTTHVSLYGQKKSISTDEKIVYLECKGKILLTLSFQFEGGQLYLKSVKKNTDHTNIGIGVFREVGGGGVVYQLIIEEDQKAIDLFETSQLRFRSDGMTLYKVKIE